MFIDGIGISNYRSFGPEVQRIGPFGKINLLIGQNNSGKSGILLFLENQYSVAIKHQNLDFNGLDCHKGDKTAKKVVEIGLKIGSKNYEAIIARVNKSQEHPSNLMELIEKVLRSQSITKGTGVAWFRYTGDRPNAIDTELLSEFYADPAMTLDEWYRLWQVLTERRTIGGMPKNQIKDTCIPEVLMWLSPCNLASPKVALIPAIRKVERGDVKLDDFSGTGIIARLAMLQNARYDKPAEKRSFERINEFVQNVLCNNSAKLHVPYERDTIEVTMNGRTLPLSNLGMGVHEVIILAAAATVLKTQVVCIEEPELHCHPLLQKQLLKYLKEETDNQYFISTHSAHLLDTPEASVFHVRLCNGESKVENVISDTQKAGICDDLGYHASDLLQANSIIWVEGPSDRIYLNHWIHFMAPELIEGLHYSIMFYGGRSLWHLTADDPTVKDFISLRRLNRHITILIDSDRTKEDDDINQTKKRVRDEFNKDASGFAWITEGRLIENYIKNDVLEEAIKSVHRSVVKLRSCGKYDNPLQSPEVASGDVDFKIDKVKVAKEVVKKEAYLDVLDLKEKVEKLVKFVQESNGIDTVDKEG